MMTDRPSDLPDFLNPPVVETVLSVQFDRLSAARTGHFGLYWNEIRARFPATEERGELAAAIERMPDLPIPGIGIQFEAMEAPLTPRFWFRNQQGTELIQLQKDRFIKNWRKAEEGDEYPRYEVVRAGFEEDFSGFRDFVSDHELGPLRINQCEVTYINHIVAGKGWNTHTEIGNVLNLWRQPDTAYPGSAQDVMFRARFPIMDAEKKFVGRLYVTLQPALRVSDGVPMFVFDLTARGQIGDSTAFFDLGREWIVRSFKEMTTPAMHQIWGIR